MSKTSVFVFLSVLAFAGPTLGEAWPGGAGTQRVAFEETRKGGVLAGCNLSFTTLVRDDVLRHGAEVIVNGLFATLKVSPQQIGFMLKIAAEDAGRAKGSPGVAFSPTLAYVSAEGYSSAHRETVKMHCDGPGYCAGFTKQDDVMGLLKVAASSTFTASFQRQQGGLDLSFPVHLARDGEVSAPASRLFNACVIDLVGSLQ